MNPSDESFTEKEYNKKSQRETDCFSKVATFQYKYHLNFSSFSWTMNTTWTCRENLTEKEKKGVKEEQN